MPKNTSVATCMETDHTIVVKTHNGNITEDTWDTVSGHREAGVGTSGSLHKGDALLIHCSCVWLQQMKQVIDKGRTVNCFLCFLLLSTVMGSYLRSSFCHGLPPLPKLPVQQGFHAVPTTVTTQSFELLQVLPLLHGQTFRSRQQTAPWHQHTQIQILLRAVKPC